MHDEQIIALIQGYHAGTLSDEDTIAFYQWYSEAGLHEFRRLYEQSQVLPGQLPRYPAMPDDFRTQLEQAIRDYQEEQRDHRTIPLFRRYRWGWAAAIVLLAGIGSYLFLQNRQQPPAETVQTQPAKADVAPGSTKAVLTLADGSTVLIDSARSGQLAVQDKTVVQQHDGAISYNGEMPAPTTPLLYNTLTTQRGEQSPPLILSDGTKVWLNALSSIRFPVAFSGKTRHVEITGEVYFEIAKNPSKPFHVQVNGMDVEALGTQFNVNAYADEGAMRTTLLEGKVRVSATQPETSNPKPVILQPGEQALYSRLTIHDSRLTIDHSPNVDQITAWKNGLFDFNQASLQTVLRQLSRWYDIEVKFEGPVPGRTFRGKITRDLNLSQVIQILQDVDVNFHIEGRTLVVTK